LSAERSWAASARVRWRRGADGVDQFARSAHAKIGGEQDIFQAPELFLIEALPAAKDSIQARGDFRARLGDGLLQLLEKCGLVGTEQSNHGLWGRKSPAGDSSRTGSGFDEGGSGAEPAGTNDGVQSFHDAHVELGADDLANQHQGILGLEGD
jgi:hypothetical protein